MFWLILCLSTLFVNISGNFTLSKYFPSYDNLLGINNTIQCTDFHKIPNGKVMIQNLSASRKVATISCDHGYDVQGNNNIYCVDGQWEMLSSSLPQCVKRCPSPPYIKNGALEIEGDKDEDELYPKGAVAAYSCGEGYELTPASSAFRVCEQGIWTGPAATCVDMVIQVAGCLAPKPLKNGFFIHDGSPGVHNYYLFGQHLQYSCNAGYQLSGPRVKQCMDNGIWSPRAQPVCNAAHEDADDLPCDSLPTIPQTLVKVIQQSDRSTLARATVEISCLGKFKNALAPCQSSVLKCKQGQWVGVVPICEQAVDCYPPHKLVAFANILDDHYYGNFDTLNFPIKSTVTFQCKEGFVMQGDPTLTCAQSGCWEPSPPTCVRSSSSFFINNINAILISCATGAGVLGILLVICLVVACKKKKQQSSNASSAASAPSRRDLGDHAVLLEHPDRLALIAFAEDDSRRNQNALPSYDEATRNERNAGLAGNRLHRPHWPNLASRRSRNSPNPDGGHVTRHGSFTRSAGDSMGSTDTMAVSEGSTNVTLDTASSHSGSQPASCRAHCGSLASFDGCSIINNEDIPLLEESELEEVQIDTNEVENPVISESSSLKMSTNSGDIIA